MPSSSSLADILSETISQGVFVVARVPPKSKIIALIMGTIGAALDIITS